MNHPEHQCLKVGEYLIATRTDQNGSSLQLMFCLTCYLFFKLETICSGSVDSIPSATVGRLTVLS
jgi:hypothetical protein